MCFSMVFSGFNLDESEIGASEMLIAGWRVQLHCSSHIKELRGQEPYEDCGYRGLMIRRKLQFHTISTVVLIDPRTIKTQIGSKS